MSWGCDVMSEPMRHDRGLAVARPSRAPMEDRAMRGRKQMGLESRAARRLKACQSIAGGKRSDAPGTGKKKTSERDWGELLMGDLFSRNPRSCSFLFLNPGRHFACPGLSNSGPSGHRRLLERSRPHPCIFQTSGPHPCVSEVEEPPIRP